ncbi:site-specific integrase [Pseudomonas fulva]|uniref:tyrosine-type recombinase/integrase n=1 Tax=Pseudomonas fulva TaxID=47880 RepID=UPI0018A8C77D|nr:site-specific integrase [Pseudomonas fulva]QPH46131.1 site-specific integrase [Pseudomonas fulva]
MRLAPIPLFDTFSRFNELNFLGVSAERPVVLDYLRQFAPERGAIDSYLIVRSFLKSYAGNESTFISFRTHAERLLLWSLLLAQKPIIDLRRSDAEKFMEFCLQPPASWVGPVVKSRFVRLGGRKRLDSDNYVINEQWRPFSNTISKRERKISSENSADLRDRPYQMAQGSVAQVFAVCGSFFQHAMDEGFTESNPFRAIKQKSVYKQRNTLDASARSLSELQWSFVIDCAEQMAAENLSHERTLFIVATVFSMYLRVSDLVGRENWRPTMGDFRRDSSGNWWFHVVGKGNKAAKISVRDDYISDYLVRYRKHLGLPPLPSAQEKTPVISTLKGRGGLSDRHIRKLIQDVFDRALQRMQDEAWTDDEIDALRSASLHWLRHTSATFDAPYRDMKDLQADLRHNSLSTTQNIYYNSLDEQRAFSAKRLKVRK